MNNICYNEKDLCDDEVCRCHSVCDGACRNETFPCENVIQYKNGEKRLAHSEVKCVVCGKKWLWGLSWDGSMDGKFLCNDCKDLEPADEDLVREGEPEEE
jgi:hypothetical protein